MRRTEHLGARALAAVGLAAAMAYLVWRAGWSMSGTRWWLAGPAYAVELFGYLGAAVLAWALWPAPRADRADHADSAGALGTVPLPLDAVVRVQDQPVHEVRATLLALRSVRHVGETILLDLHCRPEVAALATEFQTVHAMAMPGDRHGLAVVAAAVRTPCFVLLDAGDIPTIDLVDRLAPDLADDRVAVVQGAGVSVADDSPEHGPNRRHELVFERAALNPGLGARGVAMWLGSGSLVRADALREAPHLRADPLEAHWRTGLALLAAGWRITAPRAPVVAHRSLPDDAAVYADRVARARTARRMLLCPRGALRGGSLTLRQRLAALAWAVRPLSGLRRGVFVAVLCGAILAGSAPFHASTAVLAVGWLPAFAYTSLGLSLLSGWTLRTGDRVRWSLHTLGPAYTGLQGDLVERRDDRPVLVSFRNMQYAGGLIVAVIALSIVLMLRGLSDQVTHTLGEMPERQLMVLLIVSLWTLAVSLDLLRVLARRAQMRRLPRVVSSLSATLGGRAVSVVDLTALGAGIVSHVPVEVGEHLPLDTSIPTRTGVTDVLIDCIVRNVTPMPYGEWRIGVEFAATDDAAANALAEFCGIEPVWERLGVMPGRSVTEARAFVYLPDPEEPTAGRMAVRMMSLVALAGAVASSIPSAAEASAPSAHHLRGVVVVADGTAVEGAVVTAVCSQAPGVDGSWGTADDRWDSPVSTETAADGSYSLSLRGQACWSSVAPPARGDGRYVPARAMQPLDVHHPVTERRTVLREVTGDAAALVATGGAGAVTTTVWLDRDADGVRDADEPGMGSVCVTLLASTGAVAGRVLTDADGSAHFGELAPGRYRLSVTDLPGDTGFTGRGDSAVHAVTGRSALFAVADGTVTELIGLRDTTAPAEPAVGRVLVAPSDDLVAALGPAVPSTLALTVLVLAGMLALSIMFGLVRPADPVTD